ncbi:MAG: hypothetical protein ACT6S0_02975 [Roseateles sp.]|uniref:hypothetical protein n=1 Tax=Roseateles sp. TaxID=1971397 RepID=UPI0040365B03
MTKKSPPPPGIEDDGEEDGRAIPPAWRYATTALSVLLLCAAAIALFIELPWVGFVLLVLGAPPVSAYLTLCIASKVVHGYWTPPKR